MRNRVTTRVLAVALLACLVPASASSHREAPAITERPKVDGTDFYMFRSYEPGREGFATIVANYLPLQDPYGGPNYFPMDPDALYEIHIDNNGDAVEDITFQLKFQTTRRDIALQVGPKGSEVPVAIPLINVGPITSPADANLNVLENYTMDVVFGDRRTGTRVPVTHSGQGLTEFIKPVDNIGTKSIPNYDAYANQHIYNIDLPNNGGIGRLFVGQRKDPFVVNLGETFDLVNIANPVGEPDAGCDTLAKKNISSWILELPITFLADGEQPVIGGWTTASLRQARVLNPRPSGSETTGKGPDVQGGAFTQVSRLGSPLVNELVIGLPDKDRFNASEPKDDTQFLKYVTNPTLPELLEILFGVEAPNRFPRDDLVSAFLTGVDGLNDNGATGEMLRLNTAISPTPMVSQSRLGVLESDLAGFPNGRRPGDDVVDIELRVAMGALLDKGDAPAGQLPFTDGAIIDSSFFDNAFPYLRTPLPGSPNSKPQ